MNDQFNSQRQILFSVGVGLLKDKFLKFSSPRFQEYANYHGFEYYEITQYHDLDGRPPHWIKIDYILKLLQELKDGDMIAFLDADIAIVRGDIKLNTTKSIAFARDSSGIINSGVFVLKVNDYNRNLFKEIWSRTDCCNHVWQENIAIIEILDNCPINEKKEHLYILPNCLNVTLVQGEYQIYDKLITNPCVEPIRFRHFAGKQPWFKQYFERPIFWDNNSVDENNFSQDLSVHFITPVLNGEPFIRYHIEVFKKLPFKWHWHIVEGVMYTKTDFVEGLYTQNQTITDDIHNKGRSKDSTSEYLDELQRHYPDRITVYRKPEGEFWSSKADMMKAPLPNIYEEALPECLLWQIDVDELWTAQQIYTARKLFIENPEKIVAYYKCLTFVGGNKLIFNSQEYALNSLLFKLRTWRLKASYTFLDQDPPTLLEPLADGWRDVAVVNPFFPEETQEQGLVFQHFAFVTLEQVKFKEKYYGYQDAVSGWLALQNQTNTPLLLHQYFSWITEEVSIDTVESCEILPIAQKSRESETWQFIEPELLSLNLRAINLIIFPNWFLPEADLKLNLEPVIRAILIHPDRSQITLLVDITNISEEEAYLILSGIVIDLMMTEDINLDEEPQISFLKADMCEILSSTLFPQIKGRISLNSENEEAILQAQVENIPIIKLDGL